MRIIWLLLALPLIEIALFVVIGGAIGLWLTLGFVLGSALLGMAVMRRGAMPVNTGRANPIMRLASGGFSLFSGLLLVVPGFLTSVIGLLLLVPLVQKLVILIVGQRLSMAGMVFPAGSTRDEEIIEGDFQEIPPRGNERSVPSKWRQD